MSKKLTIATLLQNKEKLKNRKPKVQSLYIESLDAEIIIQEPEGAIALESLEMAQNDAEMADIYMVYNSVIEPNLKDSQLHSEFECKEPTDIVKMIFRAGEITAISGHVLNLAGYGSGVKTVDEELKN